MKLKSFNGLTFLIGALCAINCVDSFSESVKIFKELKSLVDKLESADNLDGKDTGRDPTLLRKFVGLVKSTHCKNYFDTMIIESQSYKTKAITYITDSKDTKNWLKKTFVVNTNAMKPYGRFDPLFNQMTERYELGAKRGKIGPVDIECDINKYQVTRMADIFAVLETEIKYLVIESPQLLNQEIYNQIKADRFVATHNFYETLQISDKQKQLLLQYFAEHVEPEQITAAKAAMHFNPGEFITGRLLDSCNSLLSFKKHWYILKDELRDTCEDSDTDPVGGLTDSEHRFSNYDSVFDFCADFNEAINN